jgi:hypothetical protein
VLLDEGFAFAAARSHGALLRPHASNAANALTLALARCMPDAFLEQLENMFDNADAQAPWRDVAFELGGGACNATRLEAHRCVLAARCPYLAQRFPRGAVVALPGARFPPAALASVLRWCYTGRLAVARRADAEPTAALLAQLKLKDLAAALRAEAAAAPARQQALALEPPRAAAKAELQAALACLADAASDASALEAGLSPERVTLLRAGAAELRVKDTLFWAHLGFLCPRSEFFAAMLSTRWRDGAAAAAAAAPLVLDDVSPAAFAAALRWAYTDVLQPDTPLPLLLELLHAGDRLLLEGLKQRAALLLIPHLTPASCVPLLRVADAAATPRLAAAAAAAVAEHLEALADCEELAAAVADSARCIRGRQLTDSIPVLDDIAFQVRRLHGPGGDLSEEEEEDWEAADAPPEARCAAAAAARHGAKSVRRRKAAIVRQLAAAVQGWDVVVARRA